MGIIIVIGIWVFLWIASSAIISKNKKTAEAAYEEFENGEYFDIPDEPEIKRESRPFSYDDAYLEESVYDHYRPAVSSLSVEVPPSSSSTLNSVLSEKLVEVEKGPEVEYIFKKGFELDKAVVYAEVLNPKYKEY